MRSCDEILELLSARLDGTLSQAEEAELEAHLSGCAGCAALARDLEGLHSVMPSLVAEPPPALLQGVMDQIKTGPKALLPFPDEEARRHRHQRRNWGAVAAVLAVAVLGAATLRLSAPSGGESMAGGGGAYTTSLYPAEPESAPAGAAPFSVPEKQTGLGSTGGDGGISAPGTEADLAPMTAARQSTVLTETEALMRLYEEQFSTAYPDAELAEDGTAYRLSLEERDGGARIWNLAYAGPSEDGIFYTFHWYVEADGTTGLHTVLEGWYGVSQDGEVMEMDGRPKTDD